MSPDQLEPGFTELLVESLAGAYCLSDAVLARVAAGQMTVNYAGTAGGIRVFVKQYLAGTDLAGERDAIELSEFAGHGGVPTARLVRTSDGSMIYEGVEAPLSVWHFVDGVSADVGGMDGQRMAAAGAATGRLHRVLAGHPSISPAVEAPTALCDLSRAAQRIEYVLGELSRTATSDRFLAWAAEVLQWRLALMPRLAEILAALPPLQGQVVHGDLAAPNLLFHGGEVAAIVDFRPPRKARLVSWEVSRLACDPRAVLRGQDWLRGLGFFVAAYRDEYPQAPRGDLLAAVRAWVCYSASSIYPYDELVSGRPLFPEALRAYARQRQEALVAVLENLASIEEAVQGGLAR
jgi:homoserine kinase type II